MHFYKGAGCPQCNKGYRGRIGVFEILTMDSNIREAIASGANGTELRRKITAAGDFTSMMSNAVDLVNEGKTTLEEVIRTVATID
jgi:type IV pilus assembly protein PilB